MANILDLVKKRWGKDNFKAAALDLGKLTLETLVELKEKAVLNPAEDYSQEFIAIVRDYFQKFFRVKYKFTNEEL
ncbi:MAG: hypothetical protein V1740_07335, partial [Candidatus Woesearchaeota archaeon]